MVYGGYPSVWPENENRNRISNKYRMKIKGTTTKICIIMKVIASENKRFDPKGVGVMVFYSKQKRMKAEKRQIEMIKTEHAI